MMQLTYYIPFLTNPYTVFFTVYDKCDNFTKTNMTWDSIELLLNCILVMVFKVWIGLSDYKNLGTE